MLKQPQGVGLWRKTIWFLLPPPDPLLSPKTSHLITTSLSPQPLMIKGQACHLVSRPSLKQRQKGEWEWRRKTPWHTGLMKAMNHRVVFKEHISDIINSAQRPELGWTGRSLHQPAAPLPAIHSWCSAFHIKSRPSLGRNPHSYFQLFARQISKTLKCN